MSGLRGFVMAAGAGTGIAAVCWGVAVFGRAPDLAWMASTPATAAVSPASPHSPAMVYAEALQEGNWNRAIELTEWMEERLARVATQGGGPEAVEAARAALVEQLMLRPVAGNQLTEEGIEDQYLFAPGTTLEMVKRDRGRTDLEEPVAERVWLKVSYPQKSRALWDIASVPLKSIVVGLNVSDHGRILKANIVGNVEIDWSSFSYEWEEPRGE